MAIANDDTTVHMWNTLGVDRVLKCKDLTVGRVQICSIHSGWKCTGKKVHGQRK
jgi:hypothetical protein